MTEDLKEYETSSIYCKTIEFETSNDVNMESLHLEREKKVFGEKGDLVKLLCDLFWPFIGNDDLAISLFEKLDISILKYWISYENDHSFDYGSDTIRAEALPSFRGLMNIFKRRDTFDSSNTTIRTRSSGYAYSRKFSYLESMDSVNQKRQKVLSDLTIEEFHAMIDQLYYWTCFLFVIGFKSKTGSMYCTTFEYLSESDKNILTKWMDVATGVSGYIDEVIIERDYKNPEENNNIGLNSCDSVNGVFKNEGWMCVDSTVVERPSHTVTDSIYHTTARNYSSDLENNDKEFTRAQNLNQEDFKTKFLTLSGRYNEQSSNMLKLDNQKPASYMKKDNVEMTGIFGQNNMATKFDKLKTFVEKIYHLCNIEQEYTFDEIFENSSKVLYAINNVISKEENELPASDKSGKLSDLLKANEQRTEKLLKDIHQESKLKDSELAVIKSELDLIKLSVSLLEGHVGITLPIGCEISVRLCAILKNLNQGNGNNKDFELNKSSIMPKSKYFSSDFDTFKQLLTTKSSEVKTNSEFGNYSEFVEGISCTNGNILECENNLHRFIQITENKMLEGDKIRDEFFSLQEKYLHDKSFYRGYITQLNNFQEKINSLKEELEEPDTVHTKKGIEENEAVSASGSIDNIFHKEGKDEVQTQEKITITTEEHTEAKLLESMVQYQRDICISRDICTQLEFSLKLYKEELKIAQKRKFLFEKEIEESQSQLNRMEKEINQVEEEQKLFLNKLKEVRQLIEDEKAKTSLYESELVKLTGQSNPDEFYLTMMTRVPRISEDTNVHFESFLARYHKKEEEVSKLNMELKLAKERINNFDDVQKQLELHEKRSEKKQKELVNLYKELEGIKMERATESQIFNQEVDSLKRQNKILISEKDGNASRAESKMWISVLKTMHSKI
ncbi:hypothetical protein DAMA08_005510 [Martiniozyma asiatica (nom. inval.)]|nr:hypothetical protein DAMA08_005510 [Martiniozyma asiatica]